MAKPINRIVRNKPLEQQTADSERQYTREEVEQLLIENRILKNTTGLLTAELIELWNRWKNEPVQEEPIEQPEGSNYDKLLRILEATYNKYNDMWGFANSLQDTIGELKYFWTRIDEEKINADKNFTPTEIKLEIIPPSEMMIDDNEVIEPFLIIDYLEKRYEKYTK